MKYKTDKGVAGLTILLSVIVTLFIIGLLVMVFSIMGGKLRDATYDNTNTSVANETAGWLNQTNYTVDYANYLNFGGFHVTLLWNVTSGTGIPLANVTVYADGKLKSEDYFYNSSNVSVSYFYSYDAENTGTEVINETTFSIAHVTDWFDIFIVITAMVVLVLLVVIIITAIRSSGLAGGVETSGANKVGTA